MHCTTVRPAIPRNLQIVRTILSVLGMTKKHFLPLSLPPSLPLLDLPAARPQPLHPIIQQHRQRRISRHHHRKQAAKHKLRQFERTILSGLVPDQRNDHAVQVEEEHE